MMHRRSLLKSSAAGIDIDTADVFSALVYGGRGTTHSYINEIDLAGEGGLVWIKGRTITYFNHLFDTNRGATQELATNSTGAQVADLDTLTAFNSDGFTLDTDSFVNNDQQTFVAWTFRKSPRFFDVVTYTGDGVAGRDIAHSLGVAPGMILIKSTSAVNSWAVYHKERGATEYGYLDLTNTFSTSNASLFWNSTSPDAAVFTVGSSNVVNQSGVTYVAYIFAHDDTDNGVIQCGSYTGSGSTSGPTITLGWEPQYLMIKRTDSTGGWYILDSARGLRTWYNAPDGDNPLLANSNVAETTGTNLMFPLATGFKLFSTAIELNANGGEYVYMAIRKNVRKFPWDLRYLTEKDTLAVPAYIRTAMAFKPDGTRFYVVGRDSDILQYDLSTPWDITSATHTGTFTLTLSDWVLDIKINPAGTTIMLVSNATPKRLIELTLSTPWLITSASETTTFTPATNDGSVQAIAFNDDGTKLYTSSTYGSPDVVVQYGLNFSFPYKLSGISVQNRFTTDRNGMTSMHISDDGRTLYLANGSDAVICQYWLKIAWDTSSSILLAVHEYGGTAGSPGSRFAFKPDGTELYRVNSSSITSQTIG